MRIGSAADVVFDLQADVSTCITFLVGICVKFAHPCKIMRVCLHMCVELWRDVNPQSSACVECRVELV